jgi:hypothetical protein
MPKPPQGIDFTKAYIKLRKMPNSLACFEFTYKNVGFLFFKKISATYSVQNLESMKCHFKERAQPLKIAGLLFH